MDSAIQRLNNRDLFAQYAFVFINFDLPTTDKSPFFFFRVVAWGFVGLLVFGGVLGGVLGGSGDKSLGEPYKQAVSKDNEKCSEIGNKMLNSKGSAVDAAIAAMFCLGVIHMQSSGVGGGGVMLVYNRKLKKAAPAATKSEICFHQTNQGTRTRRNWVSAIFLFRLAPARISPRSDQL